MAGVVGFYIWFHVFSKIIEHGFVCQVRKQVCSLTEYGRMSNEEVLLHPTFI